MIRKDPTLALYNNYLFELTWKMYRELGRFRKNTFITASLCSLAIIATFILLLFYGGGRSPGISVYSEVTWEEFQPILGLVGLVAIPFVVGYFRLDFAKDTNKKLEVVMKVIATIPNNPTFRVADLAIAQNIMSNKMDDVAIELAARHRKLCYNNGEVIMTQALPYLQDALDHGDYEHHDKIKELMDLCFDAGALLPKDAEREVLIARSEAMLRDTKREILRNKKLVLEALGAMGIETAFDDDALSIPDLSRLSDEDITKLVEDTNDELSLVKKTYRTALGYEVETSSSSSLGSYSFGGYGGGSSYESDYGDGLSEGDVDFTDLNDNGWDDIIESGWGRDD